MQQLLSGLVRGGVAQISRRLAGLLILAFAALLLFLCFLALLFALYLWLAAQMAPWYAALCIAGILLFLAAFAWISGRRAMRGKVRRTDPAEDELRQMLAGIARHPGRQGSLTLVASAAILGLLVGRNVSK